MRSIPFALLAGAAAALAGCGDYDRNEQAYNEAENAAYGAGEGNAAYGTDGATATGASYAWPAEARIVEESGVTYRVDPDGTRVRLEDTDSRIVTENDVRFRVDPDGTRVRIDETGAAIRVDDDDVDARIDVDDDPSLEVNTR